MLVPLLPDQVSDNWALIGPCIAKALPEGTVLSPVAMSNVLRSVLAEESMIWVWYDGEEDFKRGDPSLGLMSFFYTDPILFNKSLFIYALTSFRPLNTKRVWEEGIEVLRKFASASGCDSLLAYSSLPQLASHLETLGWDTQQRLLGLEV